MGPGIDCGPTRSVLLEAPASVRLSARGEEGEDGTLGDTCSNWTGVGDSITIGTGYSPTF
jgi:hypothetical protein